MSKDAQVSFDLYLLQDAGTAVASTIHMKPDTGLSHHLSRKRLMQLSAMDEAGCFLGQNS
jgi:hypothetical protein